MPTARLASTRAAVPAARLVIQKRPPVCSSACIRTARLVTGAGAGAGAGLGRPERTSVAGARGHDDEAVVGSTTESSSPELVEVDVVPPEPELPVEPCDVFVPCASWSLRARPQARTNVATPAAMTDLRIRPIR